MNTRLLLLAALALPWPALAAGQQQCDSDDAWMCCAILCLANPAGPTAQAECRPPINRLKQVWRNGGSMPTCPGLDSNVAQAPFDPCPLGSVQAGDDAVALTAAMPPRALDNGYASAAAETAYRDSSTGLATASMRVCVAGPSRGPGYVVAGGTGMDQNFVPVTRYDAIYLQPMQTDRPYLMQIRNADGSTTGYRFALP